MNNVSLDLVPIEDKGGDTEKANINQNEQAGKIQGRRTILLTTSGGLGILGVITGIGSACLNNTPLLIATVIFEGSALFNYFGTYYVYPCSKLPDDMIVEIVTE